MVGRAGLRAARLLADCFRDKHFRLLAVRGLL
jgi:hypothetical protein